MHTYKVKLENIEYEGNCLTKLPECYFCYVIAQSTQDAYIKAVEKLEDTVQHKIDACVIDSVEIVHMLYEVLYYASHPSEGNDDCLAGADYAVIEEALADFSGSITSKQYLNRYTAWVILKGIGDFSFFYLQRKNPEYVKGE